MICLNCGKTIDDDLKVCPFCGSLTEAYEAVPSYYDTPAEEEAPAEELPDAAPDAEDDAQDFFDEDPVYASPKPEKPGRAPKFPAVGGGFNLATVLSAVSCLLSLLCLFMLLSLRGGRVRSLRSPECCWGWRS